MRGSSPADKRWCRCWRCGWRVRPRLIDILRLPELAGIREEDGAVIVGATTRQAQAERDPVIRASVPMLARVLPWVGHPPTRNRGTVGGSIANADPSAEIPLVAVTLGAEILLATPDGPASMPADDFFIGPMLTTIGQGECVSAIRFPVWPHKRIGTGFFEISARKSDFAFVAAAAQVALDEEGRCLEVALGVGGVGDRPLRLDVSSLNGTRLDAASIVRRGQCRIRRSRRDERPARQRCLSPPRRGVLCVRALEQARDNAAAKPRKARDESRTAHQRRQSFRRCRAAQDAARRAAREFSAQRHPCRLRAWRLRRLHGAGRWRAGAILPDVRGAGRRLRDHHHRGPGAGAGRTQRDPGRLLRNPWPAMRLLHARA